MTTDDYQSDHDVDWHPMSAPDNLLNRRMAKALSMMELPSRERSPHDECPTCGGCVDAPLVGWSGCWHTPGDDCLLNYCHPCRDECHQ